MKDIYISNLSENTTKRMIFDHFRKYGEIIELKTTHLPNGKCKGYAKMTVPNEEVAGIILSSNHTIDNRDIKVEPFIKREDDILKKDIEVVRRRICVVGIPKSLKNAEFFEYFEKEIGGVENAYIRINKSKVMNYGFVTFNSEKMAIKAKRRKIMMIYDPELKKEVKLDIKAFMSRKDKLIKKGKAEQEINFKNYNWISLYGNEEDKSKTESSKFFRGNLKVVAYLNIYGEFKIEKLDKLLHFDFIPKERIVDYLKNLMKNNKILQITQSQIRMLELFYFNNLVRERQKDKKGKMNYKKILLSTRKIHHNHNKDNIALSYKIKHPEQIFIAETSFWTDRYKRKKEESEALQLMDLFNAFVLASTSNFEDIITNGNVLEGNYN